MEVAVGSLPLEVGLVLRTIRVRFLRDATEKHLPAVQQKHKSSRSIFLPNFLVMAKVAEKVFYNC